MLQNAKTFPKEGKASIERSPYWSDGITPTLVLLWSVRKAEKKRLYKFYVLVSRNLRSGLYSSLPSPYADAIDRDREQRLRAGDPLRLGDGKPRVLVAAAGLSRYKQARVGSSNWQLKPLVRFGAEGAEKRFRETKRTEALEVVIPINWRTSTLTSPACRRSWCHRALKMN